MTLVKSHTRRAESDSLVGLRPTNLFSEKPNYEYWAVALTYNFPRKKWWVQKTSFQQRTTLKQIVTKFIGSVRNLLKTPPLHYQQTYEECKDGNIHTHVMFAVPAKGYLYFDSFIKDMAKLAHDAVHAKLRKLYKESYYYPQFIRYRHPMICLQYLDGEKAEGEWYAYIHKYS